MIQTGCCRALEETFYPAMEDHRLPITVGQGAGARVVTLDLPPFTLVGATTRTRLLTTPLRDRFGVTHRLELYTPAELGQIVRRSAGILEVEIDDAGAEVIASRARGTPRAPTGCARRVRDFAEVRGAGRIDAAVAASSARRSLTRGSEGRPEVQSWPFSAAATPRGRAWAPPPPPLPL